MEIYRRSLGALTAAALVAPLLSAHDAVAEAETLVGILAADGRFVRFLDLIERAGLTDQLRGSGPFTVFAPTDLAFGRNGATAGPNADPAHMRAVVGYFILPGQALTLAQLITAGSQGLQTLNGTPLAVRARPGEVPVVLGAGHLNIITPIPIVQADVRAENGIIQVIGGVLFP